MIAKSNLSNLRVMDFFQVLSLIDTYLQKEELAALRLQEVYEKFKLSLLSLDESLQKVSTKHDTKVMRKADKQRNEVLVALRGILSAYSRSPVKEQAAAGASLLSQMQKYGKSIQKLPLREKSATINNLLQDLQKGTPQQEMRMLGLAEWSGVLKSANIAFEQVYVERSNDQAEIEVGKVKLCRTDAQKAFDLLCKTINSLAFIDGPQAYKSITDKIDNEVSKAISEAKRRKSLAMKNKESKENKQAGKEQASPKAMEG